MSDNIAVSNCSLILNNQINQTNYTIFEVQLNNFTIFTAGNIFDIMEAISDGIETVADYIMQLLRSSTV